MDPYYQQSSTAAAGVGPAQGHHQSSQRSAAAYAAQQAASQSQAYLDNATMQLEQQQQVQQQSQVPVGSGHHTSASSHHHHTPSHGHHSSSRYQQSGGTHGANHRMHQHRTSAAAISDPMMASTLTDQLASASGPLTGSGSALNQLGVSSYPQAGGYQTQYVPQQQSQHSYRGEPYGIHSRYDAHYPRRSRQPTTTTSGAYHLDRAELVDPSGMVTSGHRSSAPAGYYNQTGALHQSLGNLPTATSRLDSRYGLDGVPIAARTSADAARYYTEQAGLIGPPLPTSHQQQHEPGLGSYNPLDDPLAMHQPGQHQSHAQFSTLNNNYTGAQATGRDAVIAELNARLQEAQNSYASVKRELDATTQKLGSSMHSIKTFWSPELKKERAMRKEEATKYALINDQMKIIRIENQVSYLSFCLHSFVCQTFFCAK